MDRQIELLHLQLEKVIESERRSTMRNNLILQRLQEIERKATVFAEQSKQIKNYKKIHEESTAPHQISDWTSRDSNFNHLSNVFPLASTPLSSFQFARNFTDSTMKIVPPSLIPSEFQEPESQDSNSKLQELLNQEKRLAVKSFGSGDFNSLTPSASKLKRLLNQPELERADNRQALSITLLKALSSKKSNRVLFQEKPENRPIDVNNSSAQTDFSPIIMKRKTHSQLTSTDDLDIINKHFDNPYQREVVSLNKSDNEQLTIRDIPSLSNDELQSDEESFHADDIKQLTIGNIKDFEANQLVKTEVVNDPKVVERPEPSVTVNKEIVPNLVPKFHNDIDEVPETVDRSLVEENVVLQTSRNLISDESSEVLVSQSSSAELSEHEELPIVKNGADNKIAAPKEKELFKIATGIESSSTEDEDDLNFNFSKTNFQNPPVLPSMDSIYSQDAHDNVESEDEMENELAAILFRKPTFKPKPEIASATKFQDTGKSSTGQSKNNLIKDSVPLSSKASTSMANDEDDDSDFFN